MKSFIRVIWILIKVVLIGVGALAVLAVLFLIVASMASPGAHRIPARSVLVFDLTTRITDRPVDESAGALGRLLGGGGESSLQLRAATTALRQAAQDKRITALYLHGNLLTGDYSSGYGALKELREAIQDFQKSGKPVIAYMQAADNRDYYVMSAADQILLNPFGLLAFRGLAAQGTFFKGAEDKYGLEVTPIRVGKYKSAVEPYIRQDFSAENREQLGALLKTIWSDMVTNVAVARKLTPDQLQAMVDQDGLIEAGEAKTSGLVTDLAYESEAMDKLRLMTGATQPDQPIPQVSVSDYTAEARHAADRLQHGKDKIAVVYAEGVIIDGDGDPMADNQVAGGQFSRMLRKLEQRKDVKAVVLRVNSPGGSGEASDVILNELKRLKADRPVIVSMGTVAASGGYFISMAANKIIAEPNTITGSIGVFGLSANLKKLANDHGVTFDTVKTGALADLGTISRPMTPEEQAVIQKFVDHFYDGFLERVSKGRNMPTNQVNDIAQGRVWSGADALKVGLVDEMGGLQDAIAVAAKNAGLGSNYSVIEYPEKKSVLDRVVEALQGGERPLAKTDLASRLTETLMRQWRFLASFNDPSGIYARLPFELDMN
jgi:protease-4